MAFLQFVGTGVAATLAALATLAAWVAIGSATRIELEDQLASAAVHLAIGAGLTSFLWAIFAAAGQVSFATGAILGLEAAFLLVRRAAVTRAGAALGRTLREMCAGPLATAAAVAAAAVYWINAAAPPRDADVVRYHLEHIRQIVTDGAWLPIPDYHFALPFGWSLNYLPFERFGLPQGAHMLNLGLWLVAVALLYQVMRQQGGRRVALILCAAAVAQPLLLKSATTAHADMVTIFVVTVAVAVLADAELSRPAAFALGYVTWAAAGSRYQAVALGVAAGVIALAWAVRSGRPRQLLSFAGGAGLGLLVALPFYLFNWRHFGNPVWPLLVDFFNQPPTYADQVAGAYSRLLVGPWQPSTLIAGLREALTSAYTFPIPHAVLGFLLLSAVWRTRATGRLAGFGAAFLLLWTLAQPSLYARFFIYLLPVAWVGLAGIAGAFVRGRALAWAWRTTAALALGLAGLATYYSFDAAAYAATGDLARYHRTTWFYDVYEWIDANTPPEARFLVVLSGAPTYYLDRPLRRADPWTSGVVDWTAVGGADDLVRAMREGGYDYLLYEWRNWRQMPGGDRMIAAVREVMDEGQLREVRRFDATLVSSRVLRESHVTPVFLFALPDAAGPGAEGGGE